MTTPTQGRVPAGVSTGGRFTTSPRAEAAVSLAPPPGGRFDENPVRERVDLGDLLAEDIEDIEDIEPLEVGQWVEDGDLRVRLIEPIGQPPTPEPMSLGVAPEPLPREPDGPQDTESTERSDQTPTLVLDTQVRDSHPDAGAPIPGQPGWTRPQTMPALPPRAPARLGGTARGRGILAAFALRQLKNTWGDLKAASNDIERLFEASLPRIR